MNIINLIVIVFFPVVANASLSSLFQEFTTTNRDIVNIELDKEIAELNIKGLTDIYDWNFQTTLGHEDSNLTGFNPLFAQNTRTDYLSLSLSKDFLSGTDFTITQTESKYDFSETTAFGTLIALYGDKPVESRTVFELNQDLLQNFLGRERKLNLKANELNQASLATKYDSDSLVKIQEFIDAYINAIYAKSILEANKNALIRTQQRNKTIGKRYKDGLSRKTDWFQSNVSFIQQKEKIQDSNELLFSSLNQLSTLVHREIVIDEIPLYNLKEDNEMLEIDGVLEDNLDLKSLVQKIESSQIEKERTDLLGLPSLNFNLGYETNAFEERSADNLRKWGDNDEIRTSITLSYPLGQDINNTQKQRAVVELNRSKVNKDRLEKNLKTNLNFIKKRINFAKENLELSKKRYNYADQNVKEHYRLYNLGRTSLESVLIAEENLYNTEVSYASYVKFYESLCLRNAVILNKVNTYLEKYSR